jgi:hypothetical protein
MAALGADGSKRKVVEIALWSAAALVVAYHAAVEIASISLGEPMGLWDTVYASIAREWPQQYQWGHFVLGHDNYGPGYPAFCRLFILAFPDVYVAHRVANLVCIVVACVLLAGLLRLNKCRGPVTASVVGIVFAMNAGSYSIQSRPDFLVLLEVIALLGAGQLAAMGRLSAWRFGLAAGVLALAAYLTKPYSAFPWAATLGYLWIFGRARYAAVATLASAVIMLLGVCLYAQANPLYFFETFRAHLAHNDPSFGWMVHQTADFVLLGCGLCAAAVAGCLVWLRGVLRNRRNAGGATLKTDCRGYWAWHCILAAGVLAVGLGWHTGAYLTYYFHLLLVPLCLLSAVFMVPEGRADTPVWAAGLLLANLLVLMVLAPPLPPTDAGWVALRSDVRQQPGLVLVDAVMEPFTRDRPDVVLADTGMAAYALHEASLFSPADPGVARIQGEGQAFAKEWSGWIKEHRPEAIYLDYKVQRNPSGSGPDLIASRNGLPWFSQAGMGDYHRSALFRIHPYYGATNERRQDAGSWETLIIKLVRKRP